MTKLPELARTTYARQLADELKTLLPGMERLAEIAAEMRSDDLYRLLGFDTWDAFCTGYLGVSKRTANRWIGSHSAPALPVTSTERPKTKAAGQSAAAGQNVPIVDGDPLNFERTERDSATPPPADASASLVGRPAGPPDTRGSQVAALRPGADGPPETTGGSGVGAPAHVVSEPAPSAPPTMKAQIAHLIDHVDDMDPRETYQTMTAGQREKFRAWVGRMNPKPDVEPARRPETKNPDMVTARRQGTVSRPSPAKAEASTNGHREVKSYFKAGS